MGPSLFAESLGNAVEKSGQEAYFASCDFCFVHFLNQEQVSFFFQFKLIVTVPDVVKMNSRIMYLFTNEFCTPMFSVDPKKWKEFVVWSDKVVIWLVIIKTFGTEDSLTYLVKKAMSSW